MKMFQVNVVVWVESDDVESAIQEIEKNLVGTSNNLSGWKFPNEVVVVEDNHLLKDIKSGIYS